MPARDAKVERIRTFLADHDEVSGELEKFLRDSSAGEVFERLIQPFEWITDSEEPAEVEQRIIDRLTVICLERGLAD